MQTKYGDIEITMLEGHVAECEVKRGPNNFFDYDMIKDLADAFDALDDNPDCRAIVLCSEGKNFCAGANFGAPSGKKVIQETAEDANPLYTEAVRLFSNKKPVIAAVQGAAVGGGFGLAVMADFRVLCPSTRMTANFVKLGFTPGFGLTHTLPRLIGQQRANLLFLTGRRINGETACEMGIGDIFASNETVRDEAIELAREIAVNAPLALISVRQQMRADLAAAVKAHTDVEGREQFYLQRTADFKEGIKSVGERRNGNFQGK